MYQPVEQVGQPLPESAPVRYEQPLTERMRTFLRLEYVYRQLLYFFEGESEAASRAAVASVLDISAILSRGDVRSEIMKELKRQIAFFDTYQNTPNVDVDRLERVMRNLQALRKEVTNVGPQYLLSVRDNEFLNSVKHRSDIPGGTCEFDLPDYSHWLRKTTEERRADLQYWMKNLRPLCDSVAELLWLLRKGGQASVKVAENGAFQHSLGREPNMGLLRITMAAGTQLFPEISGSHHRISVRFMEWSDVQMRAIQTTQNVSFELTIC